MSGNGGRRQVRQRTSKDAAYAKRLQDAGGGGPSSVSSSSNRRGADTTSTGGSNNNNEPTASGSASSSAGRKRQRSVADNGAPSPTSSGAAGSVASDTTKRSRQRGPKPGWACTRCTLHNASRKRKCEACGTAKSTVTAGTGAEAEAAAALAPVPSVSSAYGSGDGGGKKRARASNDEDNADGDGKPIVDATTTATAGATAAATAAAADRMEPTPSSSKKSRGKSHSSSSNSVSEWLRKMKQKKKQGGKSSSKGGSKSGKGSSNRSKSRSGHGRSTGNSGSSNSSRSRSKSPVPPPTATAAVASASSDITESRHSDDEGLNRQDVKLLQVRVFDRCGGHDQGMGGSGSAQKRKELSDSGPLEAKVAVGRPKSCATREEMQEKDTAKELPPADPFENEGVAPADATADAGGIASKNDNTQGAARLASPSSDRAPELEGGENDNMATELEEGKDDASGSGALLEPAPIGGDGGDGEAPRAFDFQVAEGDVATEKTRPSPAIGAPRCKGEQVDSDLASLSTGSGALGNETSGGSVGITEHTSPKDGEESNVGVVPKDSADEPDPTNGMLNTKYGGASSAANASHLHPGVNDDIPLETTSAARQFAWVE